MSELKDIIEIVLISAPWIIFPAVIIYFLLNPEKVEKWASIFAKLFSSVSKGMEKHYISKDIEYKINSFRKKINKECEGLIPYKTEIKFIKPASIRSETEEHRKDKLIIILKNKQNQDENFVRAAMRSTKKTLMPNSRRYIDPALMKSIDLEFVKNLIFNNNKILLNYYIDNCLGPELKDDDTLEEIMRILDKLSEKGVFTRMFLQELREYGLKFYPKVSKPNHFKEPKEYFNRLEEFANKEHQVDIKLNFIGEHIKMGIILIGRPEKLFKPGGVNINPYIQRIFKYEDNGIKTVYLLALSKNIFALEKISKMLDLMLDRFEKAAESDYNIEINGKTFISKCIRYFILQNL